MSLDGEPGISILLNKNLNVIIGENDSGKTAIIDSIKLLLGTSSDDYEKVVQEDFSQIESGIYADKFVIEGIFSDLSPIEAGLFLEWLSFDDNKNYELRVVLSVEKKISENGREYFEKKLVAGQKNCELRFNNNAKELLKTTYLKPLRDAGSELKSGVKSRLVNILKAHELLKGEGSQELITVMKEANEKIEDFFQTEYVKGKSVVKDIENILKDFYDETDNTKAKSKFSISQSDLNSILRKLSLENEEINLGLGNQNLLFIATELLLLNNFSDEGSNIGPNLTLIEEIEAHLHTQAQIRLIKYLENAIFNDSVSGQLILTTHSSDLVASVSPKSILMIQNNYCYPMNEKYTCLEEEDYNFLDRFLDATKSNLFFAKGIIFVEGESEMLLLPALAELIGIPLHKYGISVVNVHGTSFERYLKLFSRSAEWRERFANVFINIPIAIITDLDVKPFTYYDKKQSRDIFSIKSSEKLAKIFEILEVTEDDIQIDDIELEFATINKLVAYYNLNVSNDNKSDLEKLLKISVTEQFISREIERKQESIKAKYDVYNSNHEVFITPEWTLEYSLAKSCLYEELYTSIHTLRYKNPFQGKNETVFNQRVEYFKGLSNIDDETALEIFYPVFKKLVSKAELAQNFSLLLLSNFGGKTDFIKERLLTDKYVSYLISAILHVSGKTIDEILPENTHEAGGEL